MPRLNKRMNRGLEGVLEGAARLIDPAQLEELLGTQHGGLAGEPLAGAVRRPLRDLLERPGKRIRGRLVEIGFALGAGGSPADEDAERCRRLAGAVEALHSGSLTIDDIEDGSVV